MHTHEIIKLYEEIATNGPHTRRDWWAREHELDMDQIMALVKAESEDYMRRREFVIKYAWAIPSREAIARIHEFAGGTILEVGAGRGLWAALLRADGASVIATDAYAPEDLHYVGDDQRFTEVEMLGAYEAVTTHEADVLMLVWPPMSSMAYAALNNFRGDRVVYVGEGDGGCTGDEDFHALLERKWEEVEHIAIPQWPGIHDVVILYNRK